MVKLKISRRRKGQLVVLRQVVTNQCCGLAVFFCGFISHLIGRETINILHGLWEDCNVPLLVVYGPFLSYFIGPSFNQV